MSVSNMKRERKSLLDFVQHEKNTAMLRGTRVYARNQRVNFAAYEYLPLRQLKEIIDSEVLDFEDAADFKHIFSLAFKCHGGNLMEKLSDALPGYSHARVILFVTDHGVPAYGTRMRSHAVRILARLIDAELSTPSHH